MSATETLYRYVIANWDGIADALEVAKELAEFGRNAMDELKDPGTVEQAKDGAKAIYRQDFEALNLSGMAPFIEKIVDGKVLSAIEAGIQVFHERLNA